MKLCIVLLAFMLGWHGLPERGFAWDYTQSTNFGVLKPGDHVHFMVTPPKNSEGKDAIVTKGVCDQPGGFIWIGGPASWSGTVPPDFAAQHMGRFSGEYRYPGTGGPGPYRALTWKMDTAGVVLKPAAIHSPHPQFNGNVAGQNRALDSTTSPSAMVGAGNVLLISLYITYQTITVDDQFGNTLNAIFSGSPVTEYGGVAINQLMTAAGTYSDPVGNGIIAGVVPAENPPGTPNPVIAVFLASPVPPAPASTVVQNIPVEVGGHSLNPAVVSRQVTTSPPNNLQIVWP
ncbi:MAG: hypothetical protein WC299_13945 [Kiritimatiellia bacterium]